MKIICWPWVAVLSYYKCFINKYFHVNTLNSRIKFQKFIIEDVEKFKLLSKHWLIPWCPMIIQKKFNLSLNMRKLYHPSCFCNNCLVTIAFV